MTPTYRQPNLNEYYKLTDILEELQAMSQRESKRHEMDQHLTSSMLSLLDNEIIPMLHYELEWEPTDEDLGYGSEPPLSSKEMLEEAWRQHQKLHS